MLQIIARSTRSAGSGGLKCTLLASARRFSGTQFVRNVVVPDTTATGQAPPNPEKDSQNTVSAGKVTDEAAESTTGEIDRKYRELLLYYNRLFVPSGQFGRFVPSILYRRSNQSVVNTITKSLPSSLPVTLKEYIPREREGGAFVKFLITDPNATSREVTEAIVDHVNTHHKPVFKWSFFRWRVYPVLGRPWIEDMSRTYTTQIKVTFDGPDVSPEELYANLRRYGQIHDIIPPAPGNKDMPRSTEVIYTSYIDATTARNCANGQIIGDTTIHISFVVQNQSNPVKEWFVNHPRVSVPILIALVAGLAYLIFEPIRVFSVENKVRGGVIADRFPWLADVKQRVHRWWTYVTFWTSSREADDGTNFSSSWQELASARERLEQILQEGTNTFIIVTGPRGSGKSRLIRSVVDSEGRPTLDIDCDALNRTKSENDYLRVLSSMLGYFPVFLWTNRLSKFVDLAAQSMSGQSSGFSETSEQQAKNMLNTAAIGIHNVAVLDKPEDVKDSDYLQRHPDTKPVIVIRGFSTSNQQTSKLISDWAGNLVSSNVAQVIFVTQDVSYDKTLSEALPNRVFETITIADATAEAAKKFILAYTGSALESEDKKSSEKEKETHASCAPLDSLNSTAKRAVAQLELMDPAKLEPLGGRLTDLQAFTRRLLAGEPPLDALSAMIDQSAVEIAQMYLNASSDQWTSAQVWTVIRMLTQLKSDQDWYPVAGGLSASPLFSAQSQQAALRALVYREMISGRSVGGRLTDVRPSKPLYFAAFKRLVDEPVLCASMDSEVLKLYIKDESQKIVDYEKELEVLSKLPKRWETGKRQDYLVAKLAGSQGKIDQYEKDLAKRQADLKQAADSQRRLN